MGGGLSKKNTTSGGDGATRAQAASDGQAQANDAIPSTDPPAVVQKAEQGAQPEEAPQAAEEAPQAAPPEEPPQAPPRQEEAAEEQPAPQGVRPGGLLRMPERGSLNFAKDPRRFDDGAGAGAALLAEALSSGAARVAKVTGYTYGAGLYFSGLQLTYAVAGGGDGEGGEEAEVEVAGPRYVTTDLWPETLTLAPGERLAELGVQHGEITDQLWVRTTEGRKMEWGGLGGSEEIWKIPEDFELMGFSGNQGPWRGGRCIMNTLGPIFVRKGLPDIAVKEGLAESLESMVQEKNSQLKWQEAPPVEADLAAEWAPDREVLMALAAACGTPAHGPPDRRVPLKHWGSPRPIGEWEGVVVGPDGQVRELYAERCGLAGALPGALGGLAGLEELWMPMNELTGGLPETLTQCSALRTINIHGNYGMQGFIPAPLLDKKGLIMYVHNTDLVSSKVSLEAAAFPLYVCHRAALLELDRLVPHEEGLRREGLLTQLHPERTFTKWFGGVLRDQIAFVSHRWLAPDEPHPDDPENTKLRHVQRLLADFPAIKFVWMDFLCVPQARENAAKQQAAINSLPHYIKSAGTVWILVGEQGQSKYEVYSGRGWCRLERMTACIGVRGQDPEGHMYDALDFPTSTEIYVANKDTGEAKKVDAGDLIAAGDYNPIEGVFFDEGDKTKIAPIIKLLAQALLAEVAGHLKEMGNVLIHSAGKFLKGQAFAIGRAISFQSQKSMDDDNRAQNDANGGEEEEFDKII